MANEAELVAPKRAEWLRRGLAVGGIAGLGTGLVGGVLARVAMRAFADSIGQHATFTLGVTFTILVSGLLLGVAVANIYVAVRAITPGPSLVPALILGAIGAIIVLATLGGPGAEGHERPELARALFAGVVVLGAASTAAFVRVFRRRFEAAGWPSDGAPAVGTLLSILVLVLFGLSLV